MRDRAPPNPPTRRPTAAALPLAIAATLLMALLAGCTNDPALPDQDGDGLLDRNETDGWNVTVTLPNGTRTYHVTSDPRSADSDGDGLSDLLELALQLDPSLQDTDRDGLSDCQEAQHSDRHACTDPNWRGLTDGGFRTRADMWDTDADGVSDGDEVNGHAQIVTGTSMTVHSNPLRSDSDGDGLRDGDEGRFGADPSVPDTDADGCLDGTDPLPAVAEQLLPGLRRLAWNGTDATVRLHLVLADAAVAIDDFQVHGGDNDLTGFRVVPVRAERCTFTPTRPLVPVDVVLENWDGSAWRTLRMQGPDPGQPIRAWWNVATGGYAIGPDGDEVLAASVLTFRGSEGLLVLQPVVLQPGR